VRSGIGGCREGLDPEPGELTLRSTASPTCRPPGRRVDSHHVRTKLGNCAADTGDVGVSERRYERAVAAESDEVETVALLNDIDAN
jgi:hypothetical protein